MSVSVPTMEALIKKLINDGFVEGHEEFLSEFMERFYYDTFKMKFATKEVIKEINFMFYKSNCPLLHVNKIYQT